MFSLPAIRRLRRLCSRLRWPRRHRSRPKVIIKKLGKPDSKSKYPISDSLPGSSAAAVHPNGNSSTRLSPRVRVATFNAAMFTMAPAVPKSGGVDRATAERLPSFDFDSNGGSVRARLSGEIGSLRAKSMNDRPKSILKQSPLHPDLPGSPDNLTRQQKFARSKLRVSINLPDNEISLLRSRNRQVNYDADGNNEPSMSSSNGSSAIARIKRGKAPVTRSSFRNYSGCTGNGAVEGASYRRSTRTVLEVLRELDADILALQHVKAEEEKEMKPLSDLAAALGMNYVFAESWAPEYGNAVLSKWPIKRWKAEKIFDDTDFRNVLKATIEVPQLGEIDFYCTHLDHLDESWRMKQINAIIQSAESPHILAGGLNSLEETDYSPERWSDIVKYYEEMGKPTPRAEVMRFLKSKQYTDAKDFAGECEPVVIIAKGQSVQGTCKYGTRVDYIMASQDSPFGFAPGSYSVFSSKGTSDHHIVRVDLIRSAAPRENQQRHDHENQNSTIPNKRRTHHRNKQQPKVVKITEPSLHQSNGVWKNIVKQNYTHR